MRTGTISENIARLSNLEPFYAYVSDKYLNRDDLGIADYDHVRELLNIEASDWDQDIGDYGPDADSFAELYILKYLADYNSRNDFQIGMLCADAIIESFQISTRFEEPSAYYLEDIEEHILMMVNYTKALLG